MARKKRGRKRDKDPNVDEVCAELRKVAHQRMIYVLVLTSLGFLYLIGGANVKFGFLLMGFAAFLQAGAMNKLCMSVWVKHGSFANKDTYNHWLWVYDGPILADDLRKENWEKPTTFMMNPMSVLRRNMILLTPRRTFGVFNLGIALFMAITVTKWKGVMTLEAATGLLVLGFITLNIGAGDMCCHWFRRHFGGKTKARFFGPVLLTGSLSLSFAIPGPWTHSLCMAAWIAATFLYFSRVQRAWVIPIYSLVKMAMLGLNVETSALLLASAFFMLLNHGHITTRGKAVSGLSEGDVAISWALALPLPFIHMFPPVISWYENGWMWGLAHIHAPHFHVDFAVAAAILGVLSYSTIAQNALYAALMSFAQILLRRDWKPATVTGVIFFFSALVGAIAGEAAGASIVCMFVTPLLFNRSNAKYTYMVTFWCAIALSLSAGIVPIAAPPVAVIWAKMGLMGWGVLHLFCFTGIICIAGKAFCAWRITKHINHMQRDATFVMGWKHPLGMRWAHFVTCVGFFMLIVAHVFLGDALGHNEWMLWAVDGLLCLYVIVKRSPREVRLSNPEKTWAFDKRFVPLTVTMLVAAFETIGHDGSASALSGAETTFFLWTLTMTALMIPVVHSFSFSMSGVSDNAMVTSALIPIALARIKHHLPISNLSREFVQGLPIAEQWLILSTAVFVGVVILSSLWAGVASIGANALPNLKMAKEWGLNNIDWIKFAKWYTAGCYFVGLVSCYVLWGAMYLYYVHQW